MQAGPGRQVDDNIIIELQQRIRDLQEKLDSVGSYEVKANQNNLHVFNTLSLHSFNNNDRDHEKEALILDY